MSRYLPRRLRSLAQVTVIEMPTRPDHEIARTVRRAWLRAGRAGVVAIAPDVRIYSVPARLGGVR